MNARTSHYTILHPPGWWEWLRRELAPFPGRDLTTARIVVTVALVTVISLALQVPELAISAYMVIFVTKENRVLTKLTGVLAILGITVAVAVSLLLYGATFDYPALRIPAMALTVFAGMYLARVFVVGPLGFAIGFVVAVTQSAADGVPNSEVLVRAMLWLWVALVYPIALTVVVNQILVPAEPWVAFTRALTRRLDTAIAALHRADDEGTVGGRHDLALLELATRGSAPLLKLLHFAEGRDARLKRRHASLGTAVAATEQIASAVAALELGPPQTLSNDDRCCARALEAEVAVLRDVLPSRRPVPIAGALDKPTATLPELRELQLAVALLADSLAHEDDPPGGPIVAPTKKRGSLFVPDAFTDPAHARFALKVTLAAMSCYVLYIGLDWPGIHTAFITCCIIALESNGATRRKGTLRFVGCCVGGLLGFLSILYLVPQMESVVSLVLLTSMVTALAGWIAAGSERIAYGGLQIALAFYLCIFQGFAPGTDFDKIRDRLAGIVLGLLVSGFVFRYVWPERSRDRVRPVLARALHALSRLVRIPAPGMSREAAVTQVESLRGGITKDLDETAHLMELALLEDEASGGASHLSSARLSGIVRHAQAAFLIGGALGTHSALDAWADLAPHARDLEAALRSEAAEQLRIAGDVIATDHPSSRSKVGMQPASRRNSVGLGAMTRRAGLVRRLVEQSQQLATAI